MHALGVDVGGTGIKAAPVNIETGALATERYRISTPEGATPEDVAAVVEAMARHFTWKGVIGCGIPGAIRDGVVQSMANLDRAWVGVHVQNLMKKTGCLVYALNDADAAGLAEMRYGAGKGEGGVVIVLTFGTGIGSAIFLDGRLLPNTEFGHMEINGEAAERQFGNRARKDKKLKWKTWAELVNDYLQKLDFLLSPDLIIIGGGASNRYDKFAPLLKTRARLAPALYRNNAGIVGAALAAWESVPHSGANASKVESLQAAF